VTRIRIVVVDDSLTIRRHLCEILSADPGLEVVGEAENGKRAIELCELLRPDIITLDMVMPVMSGLTATEYIMAYRPTPILIVSASLNRGDLFKTYDALAAGAVDVLEKPSALDVDSGWERCFIATVKLVSKIKVITHVRARLNAIDPMNGHSSGIRPGLPPPALIPLLPRKHRLIAIGASTGGPSAIVEILNALPASLAVPVLFVMHIGEPFGAAFADWLDSQTPHRVRYARDDVSINSLAAGVIMAPPGRHLIVVRNHLRLTDTAPLHSCKPSVDVLFESLAQQLPAQVIGCLLTGMGRDGAAGLLSIRNSGGHTIAQDQATSVVYGMPREAALLGAAEVVLPLDRIGAQIARIALGQEHACP
jgi:two-component system chemotaxis response regulator CheB